MNDRIDFAELLRAIVLMGSGAGILALGVMALLQVVSDDA